MAWPATKVASIDFRLRPLPLPSIHRARVGVIFQYVSLQNELTPTQIFEVLSLFGAQELAHTFREARMESPLDVQMLAGGPEMQPQFCDNLVYEYYCSGIGLAHGPRYGCFRAHNCC